jgi:hypothetical protein
MGPALQTQNPTHGLSEGLGRERCMELFFRCATGVAVAGAQEEAAVQ